MTDPLSVSSDIAGLITLTAALTKTCYGIYREIKNAPRILKNVIDELDLLHKVLVELRGICEQRTEPLLPLESILTNIRDCEKKLADFQAKLALKHSKPRNFLSRIRLSFGASEIKAFVDQLQRYCIMFESAKSNATLKLATSIHEDVKSETILQDIARKETRLAAILAWLSPLEFSSRQHEFYNLRREPGTSEWIETDRDFVQWRDRAVPYSDDYKRTLWCHGHPGSGKTIACSVLVNNLLQLSGNTAVAYIYCIGQEQALQTSNALVGSLIKQLILHESLAGSVPDAVEELYQRGMHRGKIDLKSLVELLRKVTELFTQVYIVADGIDELEKCTLKDLHDNVTKLVPQNKTKFLISSRHFTSNTATELTKGFMISVQPLESDVRRHLEGEINRSENLALLVGRDSTLIDSIISTISRQCQGQFALASLQVCGISEETSRAGISVRLRHPAQSLEEEYAKGLNRMKSLFAPQPKLALRVLNYMTYTKVPLTMVELQNALSVETNTSIRSQDGRPPVNVILNTCLGLVMENPVSSTVEFFHFTLPEYLNTLSIWGELELELSGCCVTYLLSEDFNQPCSNDEQASQRRRMHPFAAYASRFWGDNIRGDAELKYKDLVLRFLTSDNRISGFQLLPPSIAYDVELIGKPSEWYNQVLDSHSFAIYTCTHLRLKKILTLLLAEGMAPDYVLPFGQRFSPLHVAVRAREREICEWLANAGADVHIRDKRGRTPLHLCWEYVDQQSLSIVPILMKAGARYDCIDYSGQTVFHYVLQYSDSFWFNRIWEKEPPHELGIEIQDSAGNAALHYAVKRRYYYETNFLLAQKANPLMKNKGGHSSLDLAMTSYHQTSVRIVQQILAHMRDPKYFCRLSPTEEATTLSYLDLARRRDSEQINLRVKRTTMIDGSRGKPESSIITAAEQEDPYDLTKMILDGAYVDFIDKVTGMTPLHHAVLAGFERPTWHLLAAGAQADVQDTKYKLTPKELAKQENHVDVAALFEQDPSTSSGEMFWRQKSYNVGRGMWAKHLSGEELQTAYRNAYAHRSQAASGSFTVPVNMQIYYDYLGCRLHDEDYDIAYIRSRSNQNA